MFALGGMIFEVLAEVALVASLRDGVLHPWQLHRFKLVQLGYNLVVAFL